MERHLKPREEKILSYLFEHKAAIVDQIHRDLFPEKSRRSVYYNLSDLKNRNIVGVKGIYEDHRMFQHLHLTVKGFDLIRHNLIYEIDDPVLQSDSPRHDLKLLDLIEWLKKFEMVDVLIAENILRSSSEFNEDKILRAFKALRSDAYLRIKLTDLVADIAFEYEHSDKSIKRAKQKLEQYYQFKNVNMVLYTVDSNSFMKRLFELDRKIAPTNRSKIYICLRDDFLFQNKTVIFENCFGEKFKLI